MRRHRRCRKN